jgi:hypothetical protein
LTALRLGLPGFLRAGIRFLPLPLRSTRTVTSHLANQGAYSLGAYGLIETGALGDVKSVVMSMK